MKTGIISDIHIDVNRAKPVINELCRVSREEQLDILIVAGDISSEPSEVIAAVKQLEEHAHAKILFVPGNHDYWSVKDRERDTWSIYRQYQQTEGCLSGSPYSPNEDWVIIGDSGWYDYSFGEPEYTVEEFDRMTQGDSLWKDSLFVRWGRSNREMHAYFYNKLRTELERHKDKKIMLVTHMLTHPAFTVPVTREPWGYFNAFLGSAEYAGLYKDFPVKYGIMGHVHYRKTLQYGNTKLICPCLGYTSQWRQKEDVAGEIRSTLQIVELS
ncbi:metallophosphoesterase [Paenibacillus oenotherae]|uniref:Metallophosphoesterase n=1 Tax=Paenibacillus oenotherae TaxID=1435645 RepID=A0ABS7D1A4_9BACL|nr:metallophosphoesterase [Paenibacillus oenotherae]MBW7473717.1 metallophosphoesterase [Paenibacillus oenotherae]